jgi:hypothetical protein
MLEEQLRSGTPPRRQEDLAALDGLIHRVAYVKGSVFGRQLASDGTVSVDLAVHDVGHALTLEAWVRICVRLAGMPGRTATVSIRDIACDPGLPSDVGGNTIDRVVRFDD